MEKPWHYLENQFLNATKENFKKALKLSNFHDAALKQLMDNDPDPDWVTLYNRYHPLHLAYVTSYTIWKDAGGQQEGQTLNVYQLLKLLVSKINKWDVQVQVVFEKTTPTYKTIFPNGHAPFIKGEIITRITAVQTLGLALNPHAALLPTKNEVDAFYTTLDNARDVQEGAKSSTGANSTLVENNRVDIMQMQYGNLGFLINKFYLSPAIIANLFELQELRKHQQNIFTGTLTPAENEGVLVHTFVSDDKMRVKFTGTGQALLYLASTPNGTNSTVLTIDVAGTFEQEFEMSVFAPANYGTHRYLTAINNSVGANELQYEIELL